MASGRARGGCYVAATYDAWLKHLQIAPSVVTAARFYHLYEVENPSFAQICHHNPQNIRQTLARYRKQANGMVLMSVEEVTRHRRSRTNHFLFRVVNDFVLRVARQALEPNDELGSVQRNRKL